MADPVHPSTATTTPAIRMPPDADDREAAAIAAAIGAHLREDGAAPAADDDAGPDAAWRGRRWAFAGRMQHLQGRAVRAPPGAPESGWAAADRTDRMR